VALVTATAVAIYLLCVSDAGQKRLGGVPVPESGRSNLGKVLAFVAGAIGVAAGIIAIYNAVKPSGPPAFSGNVSNYTRAASFISFLDRNDTNRVKLDVTCVQAAKQSPCVAKAGPGQEGIELVLVGSAAAAQCWNTAARSCSGGALLTFVSSPGASGTLSSPGAGAYYINGIWRVRDLGSGGTSPPGDPTYELDATS